MSRDQLVRTTCVHHRSCDARLVAASAELGREVSGLRPCGTLLFGPTRCHAGVPLLDSATTPSTETRLMTRTKMLMTTETPVSRLLIPRTRWRPEDVRRTSRCEGRCQDSRPRRRSSGSGAAGCRDSTGHVRDDRWGARDRFPPQPPADAHVRHRLRGRRNASPG